MISTALCLIVLNEIEGCKKDIPKIPYSEFNQVYAIDGGSEDGTIEYLVSKNIKVLKQTKLGLNNAYILANEFSICDQVIVFFPKNTLDPNILIDIKKELNKNCDLVIASRMIIGAINEDDNNFFKPRKWAVLIFAELINIIFRKSGNKIYDILHGVKGWKKKFFYNLKIINKGITVDLEMIVKGYKLGANITEVAVHERNLVDRKSHFPFWSTGFKLLRYLAYAILFEKIN
jgi:hypothetical protein